MIWLSPSPLARLPLSSPVLPKNAVVYLTSMVSAVHVRRPVFSYPPKAPNSRAVKFKNEQDKGKTFATTAQTRATYTVISKKHRAAVGPGRGVISAFNSEGYDGRQALWDREQASSFDVVTSHMGV